MEIEDDLISLKLPDATQEESIIKVIGVGGGGSNAVNHMFRQGIHPNGIGEKIVRRIGKIFGI